MKRVVVATVVAGVALLALAAPASAHSGKVVASDYRATITEGIHIAGVRVRLVEGGGRVEVTSTRPTIVVLGYDDEPYLRVRPHGVERNTRSPATYLNATRTPSAPPPSADAEAPPHWQRISAGHTARWHDHRTHAMGAALPDRVTPWQLTFVVDGRRLLVHGELVHVPGPSTVPWIALAIACAATVVLLGRRALLPALAALLVLDVVRVVGLTCEAADGRLTQAIDVGGVDLVGWALLVTAVVRLRTGKHDGVLAAGMTGLLLATVGGGLDWGDVGRSQLAVATPAVLHRACIAGVAGLGAGLALLALREAGRVPVKRAATPPVR